MRGERKMGREGKERGGKGGDGEGWRKEEGCRREGWREREVKEWTEGEVDEGRGEAEGG
jgi:hypothetical protein